MQLWHGTRLPMQNDVKSLLSTRLAVQVPALLNHRFVRKGRVLLHLLFSQLLARCAAAWFAGRSRDWPCQGTTARCAAASTRQREWAQV